VPHVPSLLVMCRTKSMPGEVGFGGKMRLANDLPACVLHRDVPRCAIKLEPKFSGFNFPSLTLMSTKFCITVTHSHQTIYVVLCKLLF
jgi:hypothetical protein